MAQERTAKMVRVGGSPRFVETTRPQGNGAAAHTAPPSEPVLVLAYHPALRRVGELLPLDRATRISRLVGELDTGPLDDPYISRQAIELRRAGAGAFEISNPEGVDI